MAEGGCHCGAVRYRITGIPLTSVICNCLTCRKTSGAQNVAYFMVTQDAFRLIKGRSRRYASSEGVSRRFCENCGTTLTFEADYLEGLIDVTLASLDDPQAYPPKAHINDRDAIGWSRHQDGLPRFKAFPPR
ncbi:GFA family protein [Pacificimonas sp. WHA3]|uniref:GFA family protein n=1 Tax=Pacificimonas pallii TaxID=2827236 RepID=A0ABS6SD41_9SPHN|nr:GFA family protein [Pacificimonas pallii]MBV7256332.1 GFA family protein [Pacificimonas pallii]